MSSLDGRVALVTGAAGGIGAAICRRLARDGCVVIAADIDQEGAVQIAREIEQAGQTAVGLVLDVTRGEAWSAAVAEAMRVAGRLDILVNNAGGACIKPFDEVSIMEWTRDIDLNLNAVFHGIKACLPAMRESIHQSAWDGAIVNIASVSALVGSPGMPAYSASKGGMRLLSKALAVDFARRGYRIRVNTIFPGLIDTPLTRPLFESRAKPGAELDIDAIRNTMLARYPIGRAGRPEEIASAVRFLAGDDSSYMVGAELVVDGGLTAG
jgi:3(or 17)beta-hydroxysteroid dehydrogenase